MATTSEIQVTEAYIGLLGRAPDPAGLTYWVAQYDSAVAAGQDSTFALKKLMNDIANSPEYQAGTQGTNVPATGNPSTSQAEAIVQDIYQNLFDRDATQADKDYWAPQLTGGSTTAPEMTINLITAAKGNANTTDADVLGFKQQAATYYVESVDQADFSRESANQSVKDVNGPISLNASKAATDALVSGDGLTFTLTTGDDSASLVMTLGNDAVTGTVGSGATYQTTDVMNDVSTGDSDSLTLSGNAGFTFGQLTNVEAVNLNLAKQVGTSFTLAGTQNVSGSSAINIDVDPTVTIAGVSVTGETDVVSTGGLRADVNTTDVTSFTAALATGTTEAAITVTGDVDLATVTLTEIGDSATNIVLADNDSTINLDGTTATNDVVSISTVGESAVDVSATELVEKVTLSGSTNDVDYTITGATSTSMTYTTTGEHDVTLTGATDQFDGATITQSGTGAVGVDLTAVNGGADDILDLSTAGVLTGGLTFSGDQGANADTFKIAAGTPVTIGVAQNTGAEHIFDANDTATDSTLTVAANFDTGEIATVDFDVIRIDANDSAAISIDEIDTDANDATVAIVGANDVTIAEKIDTAGDTTISVKKFIVEDTAAGGAGIVVDPTTNTNSGDLSITASDDIRIDGSITVQNDIVITATNDIEIDSSNAVQGSMTVTGDDFEATGLVDAQNDITITVTNEVDLDGVTSSDGDVSITGNDIDNATTAITVTKGDLTLTATNDADTSTINTAITVTAGTLTLADGKFTNAGAGAAIYTAENVVISGDTDVVDSDFVTPSLVITSTNDVTIGTINEGSDGAGFVVAGSAATGDISITTDGDATTAGTATIYTGSGNDTVVMNDGNTTFVVNTGDNTGTETITGTLFATGSVVNSGDGADTIDINSTEAVSLTISSGAGDDTVSLADTSVSGVFDLGDGTNDKVVIEGTSTQPTALGLKNIEELDISAGDVEFDWADLSGNDTSFELIGAKTLIIDGSTSGETIDASSITANALATGDIQINADAGNDVITGASDMVNVITGDAGLDTITGGDAADNLQGGADNDTITGGAGKDVIIGGDGKDTIILTEAVAVTDTVTIGSGKGAEADSITGFVVGDGATADHLNIDISEVIASDAGVTALTNVTGEGLSAGDTITILDVAGAVDLDSNTETIMFIDGDYASTGAVETALEGGGDRELTTEAGDFATTDAMLILYDDGTNSYLATLTTDTVANNGTFGDGDLTVTVIATFVGVADADAFVAGDFTLT